MSYSEVLAGDRRLSILKTLNEDSDYRVADHTLKYVMFHLGHNVSVSQVRADGQWLEERALISIEKLRDDLWVLKLTEEGQLVATGKPHDGVARPAPR